MSLTHIRTAALAAFIVGVAWAIVGFRHDMNALQERIEHAPQVPAPGTPEEGMAIFEVYSEQSSSLTGAIPIWLAIAGLTVFFGATILQIVRSWRALLRSRGARESTPS